MANELNISSATISYILNGKGREKRISEELELRVQKYAKEKNYIPNHLASSLRSGKTKIICLMVEDIADVFFANVAGLIEQIAYDNGYKIVYCSTKNDTAKTKELICTFFNSNVGRKYCIAGRANIEQVACRYWRGAINFLPQLSGASAVWVCVFARGTIK